MTSSYTLSAEAGVPAVAAHTVGLGPATYALAGRSPSPAPHSPHPCTRAGT